MIRFTEDGQTDWSSRLMDHKSRESSGINLGIIGFGNIGRAVYKALEPFMMRTFVYDFIKKDIPKDCIFVEDLKTLCELSF